MKKRILIIAILLLIIIFLAHIIRNIGIFSDLYNKAELTINSENYHRITYGYDKEKTGVTEVFRLADKTKIVTIKLTPNGTEKVTMYGTKTENDEWGNERYNVNIYTEKEGKKTVKLNNNMGIMAEPQNAFKVDNFNQRFFIALTSSIKTTTYYGEECYFISSMNNVPNFVSDKMYVSKDTGLAISEIEYSDGQAGRWPSTDYMYEFNTVTEEEFIEPDVSEYEIQQ